MKVGQYGCCFIPQVPIGQNNTTTSVAALAEKMSSLDTDISNLESKFEIVTLKRKYLEDKKETEPNSIVVTKPEDREKKDIWDKIKADTTSFLESTPKLTDIDKQQWLDLMKRSQDSTSDRQGCMSKGQKKKMNALWSQYQISS